MIITQEDFEKLKQDAFKYAEETKGTLRKGQAIYGHMYDALEHLEPRITTLDNKEVDCFYLDSKIKSFLSSLEEEIVNTFDYE